MGQSLFYTRLADASMVSMNAVHVRPHSPRHTHTHTCHLIVNQFTENDEWLSGGPSARKVALTGVMASGKDSQSLLEFELGS